MGTYRTAKISPILEDSVLRNSEKACSNSFLMVSALIVKIADRKTKKVLEPPLIFVRIKNVAHRAEALKIDRLFRILFKIFSKPYNKIVNGS